MTQQNSQTSGLKKAVLLLFVMLASAGLYAAVRNLPVITGCDFYANCPGRAGADTAVEDN